MFSKNAMRTTLCVLSILVLNLLGGLGESILNLPMVQALYEKGISNPAITQLFVDNFRLNANDFWWSLTPFMILMTAIVVITWSQVDSERFWSLLGGVWLLAIGYITVFLLSLLGPHHLMHTQLGGSDPMFVPVIQAINATILITMCLWGWIRLRGHRTKQSLSAGG